MYFKKAKHLIHFSSNTKINQEWCFPELRLTYFSCDVLLFLHSVFCFHVVFQIFYRFWFLIKPLTVVQPKIRICIISYFTSQKIPYFSFTENALTVLMTILSIKNILPLPNHFRIHNLSIHLQILL